MVRSTVGVLGLLVVLASTARAQWSPAQQAIIDREQQCLAAFEARDAGGLLQECGHPDFLYWSSSRITPVNTAWFNKTATALTGKRIAALRPVAVQVRGDVATYMYHFEVITENAKGERTRIQRTGIDVFVREGGKWLLLTEYESPDLKVVPAN